MLREELFYNSIALMHINKNAEMKKDLNTVLSTNNLTVDKMLNMTGEQFLQTNANEVMGTGQTGFGKEWVEEVVLSAELIERINLSGSLLSKATIKTMTANKMQFPVRGAKVRMVSTSETTSQPQTKDAASVRKLGTPTITLEANELIVTVYYSDTFLEDSVIEIANYIIGEIVSAYETSIHQILINGDVAIADDTNINAIDGAITALPDGARTELLKANGARKIAISKSATVDAGGNLAIENIRSARAKMGVKWLNPAEIVMVLDQDAYFDLLNLTEVETIEKFGNAATIKNGVITAIDWIEIMNREEVGKTLANGTISVDTPANNVKSQIILIHTPSLVVWFRRQLTTELSRYAEERTTGVTGSTRVAVTFNDVQNNVKPTSPCAVIVNI